MNDIKNLEQYPDVLNVSQVSEILNIGKNLTYRLLTNGDIVAKKVGKNWIIAKSNLIKFILN